MLPAIALIGRGAAVVVARSGLALGRGMALAGSQLGRLSMQLGAKFGASVKTMFAPAGKKIISVNSKKALTKLSRFEKIIQEVNKDALPIMRRNTAMALKSSKGHKRGHAKRNTVYRGGKLIADYDYATHIDKPYFQKNNVSAEGRVHGITEPTVKWIEKELKRRIKKELGR
tara:strand:- start:654 stop:1169 length:516 start_codon:yes stop_codon:yes gene_type:complete